MLIHIPMELQHSHLIKVGANILIGLLSCYCKCFFFFVCLKNWCYLIFFDIEKKKKIQYNHFGYIYNITQVSSVFSKIFKRVNN